MVNIIAIIHQYCPPHNSNYFVAIYPNPTATIPNTTLPNAYSVKRM